MADESTTVAPTPEEPQDARPLPSIEAMVDMAAQTVKVLTVERAKLRDRRKQINEQIAQLNDDIRRAQRVAASLRPRGKAGE